MDYNPIFAAPNCFLVCYYLHRLHPATASNKTALPQQSNERAEKAFNCSSIAYRSHLFTGRQCTCKRMPVLLQAAMHQNVMIDLIYNYMIICIEILSA